MFDTHEAARQLNYPHRTLAYLLRRFCGIEIDKKFQLADWRIRPLPDELKSYARMDTHYLIYVYHLLKKELRSFGNGTDNIIRVVFNNSSSICKRVSLGNGGMMANYFTYFMFINSALQS